MRVTHYEQYSFVLFASDVENSSKDHIKDYCNNQCGNVKAFANVKAADLGNKPREWRNSRS